MDDPKLREVIDASRPHFDDLTALAMRELAAEMIANPAWEQQFERSRRLDAIVADAMHAVPVPNGLADRLLAQARESVARELNAGDKEPSKLEAFVNTCEHSVDSAGINDLASRRAELTGRRRWLWVACQLTTSIAVLIVFVVGVAWFQSPPPITREGMSAQALAWVTALPDRWQPLQSAPAKTHSPGLCLAVAPRGWQSNGTPQDRRAVVYDLTRKQGRALLFVLQTKAASSFSTTPSRLTSTGGWGICAWKEGENLYVLVVDDAKLRFDQFVRPPRTVARSNTLPSNFL